MDQFVNNVPENYSYEISESNMASFDKITKKVVINTKTLQKMKKLVSLFDNEISCDIKESELIGYFLEKGFNSLIESGDIERRIKAILEK